MSQCVAPLNMSTRLSALNCATRTCALRRTALRQAEGAFVDRSSRSRGSWCPARAKETSEAQTVSASKAPNL